MLRFRLNFRPYKQRCYGKNSDCCILNLIRLRIFHPNLAGLQVTNFLNIEYSVEKRKTFLIFVVLSLVVVCAGLIQNIQAGQIDPVRVNIKNPRSADCQQKIEKYFAAGDRLLMPLGFFAVTNHIRKTDEMRRLGKSGITFVQRYDGNLTIARACEDVANVAKAGVPLALSFSRSHLKYDQQWWTNYLQRLLEQKQIVIWYLPEEPGLENLLKLRQLSALLHKLDKSDRPVITYLKSTDSTVLTEASKFMDCLVYGVYPGHGRASAARLRIAMKMNLAYSCGAPTVIAAQEAFKTKSGWTKPEHVMFDTYLALIHGARGIMWYGYHFTRDNPELLDAVLARTRILNGPEYLGEVFLKGEDNQNIQAIVVEGPAIFPNSVSKSKKMYLGGKIYHSVNWRAFNHRGNTYLIMVNACEMIKAVSSNTNENDLTIKVKFQGFNTGRKVVLLDGKSQYNWDSKKLEVELKPLGAAVFKFFTPVNN